MWDFPTIISIIEELQDSFAMRVKDKGLYLKFNLPKTPLPEMYIDGHKMREVISNLIDNAIKYSKEGGITVKVEKRKSLTGDKARISVSDTGMGVSAREKNVIFKKFSRGREAQGHNINGTGLGLFVGQKIVEAHHGKIWIESEGEGKGSTFIVEIPMNLDEILREN